MLSYRRAGSSKLKGLDKPRSVLERLTAMKTAADL